MNEPLFLVINNQQSGPFDETQLRQMIASGAVHGQTMAWREGMGGWEPLGKIAPQLLGSATPAPLGGAPQVPGGYTPPAMPYAGYQPGGYPGAQHTSGLAVASLVLGLLGFPLNVLGSIPAIICGHMAQANIKRSGGAVGGSGLAITGLVLGYLVTLVTVGVFALALVAGIALPVLNSVSARGQATKDLAQAKQVALAVTLYASDHDGKTPPNFAALRPTYLTSDSVLHSPLAPAGDTATPGYDYLLPDTVLASVPNKEDTLLLQGHYTSGRNSRRQRAVVYADNHGELKRE